MPSRAASRRALRRRRKSLPGTPARVLPSAAGPALLGRPSRRQPEHVPVSGAELADFAAGPDPYRPARALRMERERERVLVERHQERCPPELHRERQLLERTGKPRLEVKNIVADLRAGVGELDEVER